jgi:hypothetical protein
VCRRRGLKCERRCEHVEAGAHDQDFTGLLQKFVAGCS